MSLCWHFIMPEGWPSILIQWNAQTARWFEAASAYTGFHRRLAELLLPHIRKRDSLVDLGCGVGLIDMILCDFIGRVTCVDHDTTAISLLDDAIAQKSISNMQTLLSDAKDIQGVWDTALMVFFGRIEETVFDILPHCHEGIIAVVHGDAQGRLGPKAYHPPKCGDFSSSKERLDALGVRYQALERTLEYGQPFTSMADAEAFVLAYSKNPPDMVVSDYLDTNLTETGKSDFPYYLPNPKRFGVLIIGREENAHF